MIKHIYKLFGLKVFEVEKYNDDEAKPERKTVRTKYSGGLVVDYTPEEALMEKKYANPKKKI